MKAGSLAQWKKLDNAYQKGFYACPKCGKKRPWAELTPLMMNECPHCHDSFYMPRHLGNFYLFEPAGGGGMGTVYKAVSRWYPNQLLAVKLLSRAALSDPGAVRALLNECAFSKNFRSSEFLVPCLENGFDDNEYYTVMPYTSGERLDKRIERLGKLPFNEVKLLLAHLLAGEQHILNCGYLFRDMKPENIIISDDGYAKILDYGLCLSLEEAQNPQEEYISGSPYYMPPERLLGHPEDARSEIYSLGMVAFHAMAGHPFYDADGLNQLAKQHVAKNHVNNLVKMASFPKEAATLIDAMIQQDPNDRPQSFKDVLDMLQLPAKPQK